MPDFIARNVTVIDFSNPRKIQLPEVYQPQSCIIKFEPRSTDIGSACYTVRQVDKNGIANKPFKNSQGIYVTSVSLDSLDERRIPMIKKVIEYAAYRLGADSQHTVSGVNRRLMQFLYFYFGQPDLDFSDPANQKHYEEAAKRYSASVLADQKTQTPSKHQKTSDVYRFAEFLFVEVELNVFDYDIIASTDQNKKGTTPLLEEDRDLSLSLRTAIFEGVVDLLDNNKSLPFGLKVPKACGELNQTIWLGYKPWGGTMLFPRHHDFEKKLPKEWFDRDKGEMLTKEQWCERSGHTTDVWRSVQNRLEINNNDHSNLKQRLAKYAGLCFFDLLLSNTAMNQQPALDLPWFGGYFIQKAKQGHKTITLLDSKDQEEIKKANDHSIYLKSIKNRKGYEPVEVTITNVFLPQFKRYLKLRDYYLKGKHDARLFPFPVNLIEKKRESLHKAFPEIPKLGAHKARATVSDHILSTTDDPNVAAQFLQNDPKTVMKHYAAGTQKSHIQGMGGFFNALGNQIKITRKAARNEVETSVGSCKNGGTNPDALPEATIEANCTQQEGCFFCKHFCVHADETDIRKLYSVLYFINKGATRASDVNFFNDLFALVIQRIKDLLKQIADLSVAKKALVQRIEDEVFNQEALDDYWLAKLNRLEMLVGDY